MWFVIKVIKPVALDPWCPDQSYTLYLNWWQRWDRNCGPSNHGTLNQNSKTTLSVGRHHGGNVQGPDARPGDATGDKQDHTGVPGDPKNVDEFISLVESYIAAEELSQQPQVLTPKFLLSTAPTGNQRSLAKMGKLQLPMGGEEWSNVVKGHLNIVPRVPS